MVGPATRSTTLSPSPPLRPWLGTCPRCGGVAVYHEAKPGRIVGACCAGPGCWWAGKVEEEKVTALGVCSEAIGHSSTDGPGPWATVPGETQ